MTQIYGTPGGHATKLARKALIALGIWGFAAALCVSLAIIIWGAESSALRTPALVAGGAGFVAATVQARGARINFMRAYTGVMAEQTVAKVLRRSNLDAVVNGALLQRGDADHVVFGPVLAVVETKHGRGRVSVVQDGVRVGNRRIPRDPVSQALAQAGILRGELGRTPHSIVCITYMIGRPFQTRGVWVTSASDLPQVLKALPSEISSTEAIRLADRLHATSEKNKQSRPEVVRTRRK